MDDARGKPHDAGRRPIAIGYGQTNRPTDGRRTKSDQNSSLKLSAQVS